MCIVLEIHSCDAHRSAQRGGRHAARLLGGIAVDRARGVHQPRVRCAAEELGPTFVKIGQALANRPDLVGSALAGELRLLQDAMPPFPTDDARSIIREDLGAAGEQILSAMPEQPVAAASIGQVSCRAARRSAGGRQGAAAGGPTAGGAGCGAGAVAGWLEAGAPTGQRLIQPALVASSGEFF